MCRISGSTRPRRSVSSSASPQHVYSSGGSYLRQFDVAVHGAQDPEGIAYDAGRDTVLVLDQASRSVYEVTLAGQLVNTIDITSASTKKASNPSSSR